MGVLITGCCKPCVFIWTALMLSCVVGYRPVIIVHGILDGPRQFEILAKYINEVNKACCPEDISHLAKSGRATLDPQEQSQSHPGTNVTTFALYDYVASLKPLWQQVESFRQATSSIMQNAEDGVHLICFSQGGLICRGVLATLPTHNVHSLIFLASPLAGQYGDSNYLRYFFPKFIKTRLYHVCYTAWGQKISVCNYWNDPHQRERYLQTSNYLAPLNGEIEHANLTAWRDSFLRVHTLVLIGGKDDGVITPWQSSIFGFYDSNETVVEMENQDYYQKDAFGLKTLNSRGAVVRCVIPGVWHTSWHSNLTVYQTCIDKWLS